MCEVCICIDVHILILGALFGRVLESYCYKHTSSKVFSRRGHGVCAPKCDRGRDGRHRCPPDRSWFPRGVTFVTRTWFRKQQLSILHVPCYRDATGLFLTISSIGHFLFGVDFSLLLDIPLCINSWFHSYSWLLDLPL